MPQGKIRKYQREGVLAVAIICLSLCLPLLFVSSVEAPSLEFETSENVGAVIERTPGSSLQWELAPNAQVVIGVRVGQGQLLRFSIEKGDLALSTVLYGPTETKLVEHVSHEFETVEISFPADVEGLYKIELRSREMAEPRRPLELKVHPLTSVTAVDRKDSEARKAIGKAELLRADWTRESLLQATDIYDKAAAIWTSVSDFSNASLAAIKAGDVCFRLTRYPEALKHFEYAAKLSRQTGDRLSEGRALSRIGHLYSYTGDNDRAYAILLKALALLEPRQSNSTSMVSHAYAEAVSNTAEVIYGNGNLLKARNYFERASKALADDRNGKARIHLFGGYIATSTGQPEKARDEASEALSLYKATGDRAGEGLALIALGLSYTSKSDEDKASKFQREAVKIFQSVGDRHSQGLAFMAIGQASENRGDDSTALQNYENAFTLFQSVGTVDFIIGALYKIATINRLKNNFDQALAYYQRALTLSRNAKKIRLESLVLGGIALVYNAQGDSEKAVKQFRAVRKFYETIGDLRGRAVALNNNGNFLLKLGQKREALAMFERALPLSQKVGDTGILLTTLYNQSRAHLALGSLEPALSRVKDSIDIIEELRDNVGSPELPALYFAVVRKHYDLWIKILMQFDRERPGQGYDVAALLVSDRSRARSLIDLLRQPPANSNQGLSADLLQREHELRGLISVQAQYQMELSLSPKNSGEVAEIANEVAPLRAEYQDILAQISKQVPKLVSLRSFAPTSLSEIQNELRGSDTMLLKYALGDEQSYLWVVTANSFQSYRLPPRKTFEDAVGEVYPLLSARQTPPETIKEDDYQAFVEAADKALPEKAGELSRMLLGPVVQQLGNRKLLVVTEGALQSIPFEALPRPDAELAGPINWEKFIDSLLINTNEISSSPSISTLRAIRSEKKNVGSPYRTVAVIADPVFSRNDDRVRSAPMTPVIADASSY